MTLNMRFLTAAALATVFAAASFSSACSRTGICVLPGDCEYCEVDADCTLGRCIQGICVGPDEAVLLSELTVSPNPLDFGRVPAGDAETLSVTLRNQGQGDALIEDALLVGDSTSFIVDDLASVRVPAGGTAEFNVTAVPEFEGAHEAELLIRSSNAVNTEVRLSIRANVDVPCLEVVPAGGLDFGQRRIERVAVDQVTLRNCGPEDGGVPLLIDRVTITDGDAFSIPFEAIGEIAPQRELVQDVEFLPEEFILYEGMMQIDSNDPARPRYELPLRGLGADNECPRAVATCSSNGLSGDDLTVPPYTDLNCTADRSSDVDGVIASYQWEVIERPTGSTTAFQPSATVANPGFFADIAGRYVLRLTVEDNEGAESCRSSEVVVNAVPGAGVHVQLVWNTPNDDTLGGGGTDVDLHLLHPDGNWNGSRYDCYYANRNPDWGPSGPSGNPSLDVDDTDGWGPENINIVAPEAGVPYTVGIHYYSPAGFGASDATVRIYTDGLLRFEREGYNLPRDEAFWEVATVEWPSGDVVPIGQAYRNIP